MTSYAEVAANARERWLARLVLAARGERIAPAEFATIFRPLGGMLIVRMLRKPDLDFTRADRHGIEAARAMLAAWIDASIADTTPVPAHCEGDDIADTTRRTLLTHFEPHWGGLIGR